MKLCRSFALDTTKQELNILRLYVALEASMELGIIKRKLN